MSNILGRMNAAATALRNLEGSPDGLLRMDSDEADYIAALLDGAGTELATLRAQLTASEATRKELREELNAAYAELRKIRPTVCGIFDRDVWDRANDAERKGGTHVAATKKTHCTCLCVCAIHKCHCGFADQPKDVEGK